MFIPGIYTITVDIFSVKCFFSILLHSPSKLMFTDILLQDNKNMLNKNSSWSCANAKKEDNSSEHSEPF